MSAARVAIVAVVWSASLAGCSAQGYVPNAAVTAMRPKLIAPSVPVQERVMVGRSTRADVLAALGETQIIHFENGYEVWVYRLPPDSGAARGSRAYSDKSWPWTPPEYVLLFGPSGVVEKARLRPAPAR